MLTFALCTNLATNKGKKETPCEHLCTVQVLLEAKARDAYVAYKYEHEV